MQVRINSQKIPGVGGNLTNNINKCIANEIDVHLSYRFINKKFTLSMFDRGMSSETWPIDWGNSVLIKTYYKSDMARHFN